MSPWRIIIIIGRTLQWAWEGKQNGNGSDEDDIDDDTRAGKPHTYDPRYKRFRVVINYRQIPIHTRMMLILYE